VSGDERAKLIAWFAGLSKLTRRRLKDGTQKIRLETYASNTDTAEHNQLKWAEGRLLAVKAILGADRFVDEKAWNATAYGEEKRPQDADLRDAGPAEERPGRETPDPSRLIAHLEVDDERTPGADEDDPFDLLPKD
jgi:hypothetical protein